MAALANQGMRFSQAYTPNPICAPARHSMLFGQRATRHIYNQDASWIDRAPDWLTIPKALKAANPEYRTAHFGKWHVGLKPEHAGFDYTDGLTDNEEGDLSAGKVFANINFIDQDVIDAYNKSHNIDTTPANIDGRQRSATFYENEDPKTAFSLTARTSDFILEAVADGKPFYAHVAHYAVHLAMAARSETYTHFQDKPPGEKHDNPAFAAMLFEAPELLGLAMSPLHLFAARDDRLQLSGTFRDLLRMSAGCSIGPCCAVACAILVGLCRGVRVEQDFGLPYRLQLVLHGPQLRGERRFIEIEISFGLPVFRVGRRTLIKLEEGIAAIERIGRNKAATLSDTQA